MQFLGPRVGASSTRVSTELGSGKVAGLAGARNAQVRGTLHGDIEPRLISQTCADLSNSGLRSHKMRRGRIVEPLLDL
ncbi:hypothetical protein AAFF_G00437520 [Aldrovandia affinis]|uniref:Uncharacterized protein n=1 Tax=Aldrovandia affinis TaxID=143900 RepID=A0AAD7S9Y2_9TELE|nr:hypothetical protein AAFF_G00437520 [Aldrovandia affinis]